MYLLCPLSSGCCNPDSLLHLWSSGTLLLQPGEVPQILQPLQIPTDPPPPQEVGARTAPWTHTCFSLSWAHLHPETSFSVSHWMVSVFVQSESPSRGQHTSPGTCVQQEICLSVGGHCHISHHLQGLWWGWTKSTPSISPHQFIPQLKPEGVPGTSAGSASSSGSSVRALSWNLLSQCLHLGWAEQELLPLVPCRCSSKGSS